MGVEEVEALAHPRFEAAAGVFGNFAHDMNAIFQPRKFAARRGWKDRDFALLARVTVTHESECLNRGAQKLC